MPQRLIVGNWKMFTTAATARRLAADVVRGIGPETGVRVALCPPAPYLGIVGEALSGSAVALGAQNVYPEKEGAFTGETGIGMLLDLGCRYVIVGHCERRRLFGEDDTFINRKVQAEASNATSSPHSRAEYRAATVPGRLSCWHAQRSRL